MYIACPRAQPHGRGMMRCPVCKGAHNGPAHKGLRGNTRAWPQWPRGARKGLARNGLGGPQGPSPQGPRGATMTWPASSQGGPQGAGLQGPREPTRAWPERAQGSPQGPDPQGHMDEPADRVGSGQGKKRETVILYAYMCFALHAYVYI